MDVSGNQEAADTGKFRPRINVSDQHRPQTQAVILPIDVLVAKAIGLRINADDPG